ELVTSVGIVAVLRPLLLDEVERLREDVERSNFLGLRRAVQPKISLLQFLAGPDDGAQERVGWGSGLPPSAPRRGLVELCPEPLLALLDLGLKLTGPSFEGFLLLADTLLHLGLLRLAGICDAVSKSISIGIPLPGRYRAFVHPSFRAELALLGSGVWVL